MNSAFKKKIETIKSLRSFLAETGATEVFTPIIRRTSSPSVQRMQTEFNTYLRNCQELQLRLMMEYYGDVFEIGSSFRREENEDATHGREFTLLEAQFADKDMSFLISLLKNYIMLFRTDFVFEELSVADEIQRKTGINLATDGEKKLVEYLKAQYPSFSFSQNFQLVNYFVQQEIEPMSAGRCVFFTEYPACTLSLARYADESKEIIRRFEFFINGIEVSNGYENSIDVDEFVERNTRVGMFTAEEAYLANKLRDGSVPTNTGIIGIGVERLCMTINGYTDIQELLRENNIF
jgi:elongation factor P--beta-lysine ligase